MPTVAFSHKGGFWKTRYSFYSYCYSFLDRLFLSYDMEYNAITEPVPGSDDFVTWDQPVWLHDTGPGNCQFYGVGYGSQISVTFNERPSSNKIYKSMSLESTNNVAGLTAVAVNNSTGDDQTKTANVNVLDDKGGILYADLGRQNESSSANIKMVGGLTWNFNLGENAAFCLLNGAGGSYNNVAQSTVATPSYVNSTRYFFGSVVDGEMVFHLGDVNNTINVPQDFGVFVNQQNPPRGLAWPVLQADGVTLVTNEAATHTPGQIGIQWELDNLLRNEFVTAVTTYPTALYSISLEAVNGADPKGQTVDAVIQLGAANYELYALNLEYELTDYDHSDEKTRFTANRLRGGRSRKSARKK